MTDLPPMPKEFVEALKAVGGYDNWNEWEFQRAWESHDIAKAFRAGAAYAYEKAAKEVDGNVECCCGKCHLYPANVQSQCGCANRIRALAAAEKEKA